MARGDVYVCPICRTKNDDTKKYCISCGTWLLSDTFPATKYHRKRGGVLKAIGKVFGYTLGAAVLLIGVLVYWSSTEDGKRYMESSSVPSPESEVEYKASAQKIDYESLARNPDRLRGERVAITGKVFQVFESGRSVQIHLHMTQIEFGWGDSVWIFYERPASADRVLEDDTVTVWGEVRGLQTLETVVGSEVSMPAMTGRYIEIIQGTSP